MDGESGQRREDFGVLLTKKYTTDFAKLLYAVVLKWTFFDGSNLSYPVASPANDIVFTGGAPNYGVPGFVRGGLPRAGRRIVSNWVSLYCRGAGLIDLR